MKEFLINLDLQQLWGTISQHVVLWFNLAIEKISTLLETLYQIALDYPWLAGVSFLLLIGLPIIFNKIKKSKSDSESEIEGRLDQLMEEMQDFELNAPLIDLQDNFSDSSNTDMEPLHDENTFKLDFENDQDLPGPAPTLNILESDAMIELPSLLADEENGENGHATQTEEQKIEDILLSEDSSENHFYVDDPNPIPEGLTEQDSDWSQISRPALSSYDDTELTIEGIEDLPQEMEQPGMESAQEASFKPEEDTIPEIKMDSHSPTEPVEHPAEGEAMKDSATEEEAPCHEEEFLLQSTDLTGKEYAEKSELSLPEEEVPLSSHQETGKESFANHVQSQVAIPEKIAKEPSLSRSHPLNSNRKLQNAFSPGLVKPAVANYNQLLESFIFLKDQKK